MSKIQRAQGDLRPHPPATQELDITITSCLQSCRRDWTRFQENAVTTVFQTHEWLTAWQRHVGSVAGVQPIIVTGRRRNGSIAFILPFGLATVGGVRVLSWLSAPHCNYGCALFDRDFVALETSRFSDIWKRVLGLLPKCDAIVLSDQPERLGCFVNPFASLRTCTSADRSYVLDCALDYEGLLSRKLSSRSRRRFRQLDSKLRETITGRMAEAHSVGALSSAVRKMFIQKKAQLARRGIPDPFSPAFERFFETFATADSRALKCYCLEIDGEIVATNFGAVHNGIYYGLVTSMAEGDFAHLSPGNMAMNFAIEQSCKGGLSGFDFSAGDADYKERWSDRTVELFETHVPMSAAGHVYCLLQRARVSLKRRIKQSPRIWFLFRSLRALIARRSGGVAVF